MPDITFDCFRCGGHLVVDSRGAGTTISCPLCNGPIGIPEWQPAEEAVVPSHPPEGARFKKTLPNDAVSDKSKDQQAKVGRGRFITIAIVMVMFSILLSHWGVSLYRQKLVYVDRWAMEEVVHSQYSQLGAAAIVMVMFSILLAIAGVSVFLYRPKLYAENQTLLTRVTEMERKVLSQESQLGAARSARQSQATRLSDLENRNRALQVQVSDMEAANKSLTGRLKNVESGIFRIKISLKPEKRRRGT